MKQALIKEKRLENIMDELGCLFIIFLEVLSILIILYFSINIAFSADSNWSGNQHNEISLSEVKQGQLLYKTDVVGRYLPAATVSTDVDIKITGMIARAKVTQVFKNTTAEWLEGVYVFPLPEDAAVDHLKMVIGKRIIEGKIKLKQEARKIYKQAKAQGRKVSLVEQQRPNIFSTAVANIAPYESIQIVIEYQQNIKYRNMSAGNNSVGEFNLRFPMVINPRYIPGKPIIETMELSSGEVGGGWAMNTTQVPDASKITPPVSIKKINKISLRIELDAGFPVESLDSAYHRVTKVNHGKGKYSITLVADTENEKYNYADRDFNLNWQTAIGKQPRAAVFSQQDENSNDAYHLIMIMPPTEAKAEQAKMAREVIYIIDTSGSMAGTSIKQARQALLMAVDRLSVNETFNIIEFNSTAHKFFRRAVNASQRNKVAAKRFIRNLSANGGTEMAAALNLALAAHSRPSNSSHNTIRQVVFLTDGSVGNEEGLFQLIKSKLGDSRLFTVGIGSAPNSYFMTKAARQGRGTFTYIGDVNEVQQKMGRLFTKLDSPILKNIHIDFNTAGAMEVWPEKQPDLYKGEPIMIVAKSTGKLNKIKVSADLANRKWQMNLKITQTELTNDIAVLWARQKISHLMNKLYESENKAAAKQQIVKVALKHHLVSKFTSLVAVDVTPTRPLHEAMNKQVLKTNLPKGMIYKKVFGNLPQTATASELNLLTGFILLLIAIVMLGYQALANTKKAI